MKLFQPGEIGKLTLKNRIAMAPMGIGGPFIEDNGSLSQRGLDYYLERAKGGVGLIITCAIRVAKEIGEGRWWQPDDYAGFKKLADGAHAYGTKVAVQFTAGNGRVANPKDPRLIGKVQMVSASESPAFFDPAATTRALTIEEIGIIVKAFETAAHIARSAGVDAIEIHGHEGYLIDQFMTALWNRRTDRYGGDLSGRMTLPIEIIQAIKRGASADFPVIYRFGLEHHLPGGREIPEGLEVAKRLEAAGADALDVDAGCYETTWWPHPTQYQPHGCMADLAGMARKVVRIPVLAVGKLGYPDIAEKVLAENKADFIIMGRALLADPEWPNKIREGRPEDVRPCLCDHDGCSVRTKSGKYLSCTVNPQTGNEREYALTPALKKKNILVVGGGPGGMEAALIAALRGHTVTLWEKTQSLGGNLLPAAAPSFKEDYRALIRYYAKQLEKTGVAVELGKEASLASLRKAAPEVVIIATGSTPITPAIPGVGKPHVMKAEEYLLRTRSAGASVAVLGGGLVGAETALDLALKGKKVTIVEQFPEIAAGMFWRNRGHLLKLLADNGVTILTNSKVSEITDAGLVLEAGGTVEAETVMLAVGYRASAQLVEAAKGKFPETHAIGDCVQPRKIIDAIWEGFGAARVV